MNTKEIPSLIEPEFLVIISYYELMIAMIIVLTIFPILLYFALPRINRSLKIYRLLSKYKNKGLSEKNVFYQLTSIINACTISKSPIFNEQELSFIKKVKYGNSNASEDELIIAMLKKAIRVSLVGKF